MSKCDRLQSKADQYLIINPAIIQILAQMGQTYQQLNQATVRAATGCGCIELSTSRKLLPTEATWQELKAQPSGDRVDELCTDCRSLIKSKLGSLIFYTAALANAFELSLDEIVDQEIDRLDLLGYFMLL